MLNLYDSPECILRNAFDTMEGAGFFDRSMAEPLDPTCFWTLWSAIDQLTRPGLEYADVDILNAIATVYGDGGWNRYHVFINGNIAFSCMHNHNREDRMRARQLGFYMFD